MISGLALRLVRYQSFQDDILPYLTFIYIYMSAKMAVVMPFCITSSVHLYRDITQIQYRHQFDIYTA